MDRKKWILVWIATPTSRLAMTESRRHCEGAKRPKQSTKKWILGFKVWIATILLAQNLAMTEKRAKQENAFSTPSTQDFRIFDEKAGLRSLLRGDKPRWLSHKQKASSPLYRKKTKSINQKG